MAESAQTKYASFEDMCRAHLVDGPDSSRLEFTPAYFHRRYGHNLEGHVAALRKYPDLLPTVAIDSAATVAMELLHPEFGGNHLDDGYKGVARRFKQAGKLAVEATQAEPDVVIESLPFRTDLLIPVSELREVGRLSVQYLGVYNSLLETGALPEV